MNLLNLRIAMTMGWLLASAAVVWSEGDLPIERAVLPSEAAPPVESTATSTDAFATEPPAAAEPSAIGVPGIERIPGTDASAPAGELGGNPFGGGYGPNTGGGRYGVMAGGPIPIQAAPSKNTVMSANIVISISDDKQALFGYSKKLGRWTEVTATAPFDGLMPVVGDVVGCYCMVLDGPPDKTTYGNIVWAYSGSTGRWDKLELAEGHHALPVINHDMITVEDEGKLHIFSDATGRWASQDEMLASAQVQWGDIPQGMRLMTLSPVQWLSEPELKPGDRVDMHIAYPRPGTQAQQNTKVGVLLEFIEVASANKESQELKLLVTPKQTTALTIAQSQGQLTAVWRDKAEQEKSPNGPLGTAVNEAVLSELRALAEGQRTGTSGAPTMIRIYRLRYAAAMDLARVLDVLFDGRGGNAANFVPDAKTNQLIVDASESVHEDIDKLIHELDIEQAPPPAASDAVTTRPPTPQEAFQHWWQGAPAAPAPGVGGPGPGMLPVPVSQLNEQFKKHQSNSLAQAQEIRDGNITGTDPSDVQEKIENLKRQLREEVSAAFDARQQQQQAQVAELVKRLQELQATIDAREKIKARIIDRRVEELLDPNLQWDSPPPNPLDPSVPVPPVGAAPLTLPRPVAIPQSPGDARAYADFWLQNMQGDWEVTITHLQNRQPRRNQYVVRVEGDTFRMSDADGTQRALLAMQFGPAGVPQPIDFVRAGDLALGGDPGALFHAAARDGQLRSFLGIIEATQDGYRICASTIPEQLRPTQFALNESSSVWELRRPTAVSGNSGEAQAAGMSPMPPPVDWLSRLQGTWDITALYQENQEQKTDPLVGVMQDNRLTLTRPDGTTLPTLEVSVTKAGPPVVLALQQTMTAEEEFQVLQGKFGLVKPIIPAMLEETLDGFRLRVTMRGLREDSLTKQLAAPEDVTEVWELKRRADANAAAVDLSLPSVAPPMTNATASSSVIEFANDVLRRANIPATAHPLPDGQIELRGTVHSEAAYQEAEKFARSIPGIPGIVNGLRVEAAPEGSVTLPPSSGSGLPNRDLSQLVLHSLRLADVATDSFAIQATGGGHVQLQGTVPSEAVKEQVSALVEKIDGVKTVDNQLRVVWPSVEELARWQAATVVITTPNPPNGFGPGGFGGEPTTTLGAGVVVSPQGLVLTQLARQVDPTETMQIRFDDGTVLDAELEIVDAAARLYVLKPKRELTLDAWLPIAGEVQPDDEVQLLSVQASLSGDRQAQVRKVIRVGRRTPAINIPVFHLDGDNVNDSLRLPGRPVIARSGELAGMVVQGESRPASSICFALGPSELRRIFEKFLPTETSKPATSNTNPELDGVWVSNVAPTSQPNPEGPLRVVFWKGRQASFVGDKLHRLWAYSVDDSQSTRRLMVSPLNTESEAMSGIYELKGDELRFLLWVGPPPEKMEFVISHFEFKRASRDVPDSLVTLMQGPSPAAPQPDDLFRPLLRSETFIAPRISGDRLIIRSSQEYGQRLSELQLEIDGVPRLEQLVNEGLRPLADLEAARAAVKQLEILRKEYDAQIRLIELTLQEASETYSVEQTKFSDAERLQKAGAISSSEYDEQRLATRRAELEVQRLETLLTLYKSVGQPHMPPPAPMPEPMPVGEAAESKRTQPGSSTALEFPESSRGRQRLDRCERMLVVPPSANLLSRLT